MLRSVGKSRSSMLGKSRSSMLGKSYMSLFPYKLITYRSYHILITGSSGFIGSRSVVNLSKNNKVCGIDIRPPSAMLENIALKNNAQLIICDINNCENLNKVIDKYIGANGVPDYIIHYATFWDYKIGDIDRYKSNIVSTENLYNLATIHGIRGFIFASSVEVLPSILTKTTIGDFSEKLHYHPYGWSKAVAEQLLISKSSLIPDSLDTSFIPLASDIPLSSVMSLSSHRPKVSIVRIGGVFSDWCELPPLSWIINRWSQPHCVTGMLGSRIIPGSGQTGMPFVHRDDLIVLIEKIIHSHNKLNCNNVFMAAADPYPESDLYKISTTHSDLYTIIRRRLGLCADPIFVNQHIIKAGLLIEKLIGLNSPEQLWMLKHIDTDNLDRDHVADTNKLLGWQPQLRIEDCLPQMIKRFTSEKTRWGKKQHERESHNYLYDE